MRKNSSPVQVKGTVSVYSDRDRNRDRDNKNIDKFFNFFGTINIHRDRVRNRNATKPQSETEINQELYRDISCQNLSLYRTKLSLIEAYLNQAYLNQTKPNQITPFIEQTSEHVRTYSSSFVNRGSLLQNYFIQILNLLFISSTKFS